MKEINNILSKYSKKPTDSFIETESKLNTFLIQFSKDLAELTDMLSRLRNSETHPNYYNINEMTIVGSITRIIKLFKEVVINYELNKLEILTLFARPLYESFIITKYLIQNGVNSQINFRKVSYRARFENLKVLNELEDKTPAIIQRQIIKLNSKLKEDGFTISDLEEEEKKNKQWKLDGKSFWKIHSEVDNKDLYSFIYGVGSDAVHGNWQEIIDFHITEKESGYFGFLNYEKCDCRSIVSINSIAIESIVEFLKWNSCITNEIENGLNNMIKTNHYIYEIWEEKFGEVLD
ncbi:MAG TPA: DUF5677 domain-containing protein [Chitinophagales bacterium]|nr:DUF5677 domain-containing protein [Chitinophagales bacterium]